MSRGAYLIFTALVAIATVCVSASAQQMWSDGRNVGPHCPDGYELVTRRGVPGIDGIACARDFVKPNWWGG